MRFCGGMFSVFTTPPTCACFPSTVPRASHGARHRVQKVDIMSKDPVHSSGPAVDHLAVHVITVHGPLPSTCNREAPSVIRSAASKAPELPAYPGVPSAAGCQTGIIHKISQERG